MIARLNKEWKREERVSEDRLAVWLGLVLLGSLLVYVWAISSHSA